MLYEIAPEQKVKQFEESGDIDFGYEIPGLARYRANFFMQKNGVGAVFREIPSSIMTAEQLGLPPVVSKLATLPRGLILVTGPTGSGKSTTLAAIIDVANRNRKDHIITVEDPIEFVHQSQGCIVNHREIGIHTHSFSTALRGALREDPDIILVGEMRDLETISLAVEAASTGHLVFSTLHTVSAPATLSRLLDMGAPPYLVAASLQAVVAQRLVRRVCDSCTQSVDPTPGQRAWLYSVVGDERARQLSFVGGRGCNYCNLTGYRGRIGVYELLEMDAGLTDAIRANDIGRFNALAAASPGYRPLAACALDYATEGLTSLDEVMRVAGGMDALADELVISEACGAQDEPPVTSVANAAHRAEPPLAEPVA